MVASGPWTARNTSTVWADGIYCNVRLGEAIAQCLLVLIGATKDGKKELLAVADGYRERQRRPARITA